VLVLAPSVGHIEILLMAASCDVDVSLLLPIIGTVEMLIVVPSWR